MRISDWSSDVCSSDLVEQAMLSDAHRYWLNNPKRDRAATRLDQQIEREREEVAKAAEAARIENERRLDRLATSSARQKAAPAPRRRIVPTVTMRKVADHGFRKLIGQQEDGGDRFSCPSEEWQAEVVDRFVIAPLEHRAASYYDFHSSDVFRHLQACGLLKSE